MFQLHITNAIVADCPPQSQQNHLRIMQSQPPRKYKLCHTATTQVRGNFSFPEGSLDQSMNKYEREAREKLEVSRVIEEISSTLHELIDSILHDKIYA